MEFLPGKAYIGGRKNTLVPFDTRKYWLEEWGVVHSIGVFLI